MSASNAASALQRLARSVVPHHADFCFVFLAKGSDVRCVACAHATPQGERLLRGLTRAYKITVSDPVSTVAHVLRTGRPKIHSQIRTEAEAPVEAHRVLTLHRRLGACSALVVPIGTAPDVVGAFSFSYAESGRRYTANDLPRARRLADAVARFLYARSRPIQPVSDTPTAARRLLRLRARA
jgi:hypothetical protein